MVFLGEFPQEAGCGNRAAGAAADVGHVGEAAFELILVVVPQRHAPDAIPGVVGSVLDFARQRIVVAVKARWGARRAPMTQATSERGQIDYRFGLETFGLGQRNHTGSGGLRRRLLRISMVWPDIEVTMSPLVGLGVGMFSHAGNQADDVELEPNSPMGAECTDDGSAAAHVVVHFVHFRPEV